MPDRPRVLVVDDDAFLRITVSLEFPEVDLLEATRLTEAWDLLQVQQPDALLLDRWLPDGDGLDLIRLVRRSESSTRMPIVLVTAGFDEADRDLVEAAGADEFLPKPIEPRVLSGALSRHLASTSVAVDDAGSRRWSPFRRRH